mgnify:CR=1 FL=1
MRSKQPIPISLYIYNNRERERLSLKERGIASKYNRLGYPISQFNMCKKHHFTILDTPLLISTRDKTLFDATLQLCTS